MRLRLPEVHPDEYEIPHACPYGCVGSYSALHQRWHKAVVDPDYNEVIVRRYKCVKCGRAFGCIRLASAPSIAHGVCLSHLFKHYQTASPSRPGEKASIAYGIHLTLLRWSNYWPRLTFDQRWNCHHQTSLEGTNNVAERATGWYFSELYRTLRTYKRRTPVRNICRLISYLAGHPSQPVLADLLVA